MKTIFKKSFLVWVFSFAIIAGIIGIGYATIGTSANKDLNKSAAAGSSVTPLPATSQTETSFSDAATQAIIPLMPSSNDLVSKSGETKQSESESKESIKPTEKKEAKEAVEAPETVETPEAVEAPETSESGD